MSFTAATAITRLTSGPINVFRRAGLTSGQQLQRINEVLEQFYEEGDWRGLIDEIPLTTTGGAILLNATYQRLDGLNIQAQGAMVEIKGKCFTFSSGGPPPQDWTQYSGLIALDRGDVSGQRKYQISGDTTALDSLAFTGLARKRFTWISDTATVIVPDSYRALALGVEAFAWKDEGDDARYQAVFSDALRVLNGNLQEFDPETKQVSVQVAFGGGSLPFVH